MGDGIDSIGGLIVSELVEDQITFHGAGGQLYAIERHLWVLVVLDVLDRAVETELTARDPVHVLQRVKTFLVGWRIAFALVGSAFHSSYEPQLRAALGAEIPHWRLQ